jgi:hypothetical protein
MSANGPPILALRCRWPQSATPPHHAGNTANALAAIAVLLKRLSESHMVPFRIEHAELVQPHGRLIGSPRTLAPFATRSAWSKCSTWASAPMGDIGRSPV